MDRFRFTLAPAPRGLDIYVISLRHKTQPYLRVARRMLLDPDP